MTEEDVVKMAVPAFFCVKPLSWRGPRGLGVGLKPLLKDKKRLEMLVKEVGVDGDLRISCSKNL